MLSHFNASLRDVHISGIDLRNAVRHTIKWIRRLDYCVYRLRRFSSHESVLLPTLQQYTGRRAT